MQPFSAAIVIMISSDTQKAQDQLRLDVLVWFYRKPESEY